VTGPIIGMCPPTRRQLAARDATGSRLRARRICQEVQAAGGLAVLLVPDPGGREGARHLLDRIDGLLLVGGVDVRPRRMAIAPQCTWK